MNQLLKNAKKILLENRRSGYTLPTNNKLYPAQWNWDSAFIALGYSYFNLDYAIEEINTLLKGQWKDGMVPHILFHNKNTNYYPNYTAWNCGNKISSSGITQPPIMSSALKQILNKNKLNKTISKSKKIVKIKNIMNGLLNLEIQIKKDWCQFTPGKVDMIIHRFGTCQ